jgi:multidrug resistance efflux pump
MKIKKKFLFTGIVLLLAIGAATLKYWDYIINPWTRDGQVRAQVIQITSRVSGPIVRLPIRDNQLVKAGELLFEIDPRVFATTLEHARAQLKQTYNNIKALGSQVESAKANVAIFKANIKQAKMLVEQAVAKLVDSKSEFERANTLIKKEAMSQRAFDHATSVYKVDVAQHENAEAQLLAARASLTQAEAELSQAQAKLGEKGEANAHLRLAKANVRTAELNLEFTRVRASVDGYVTNLNLRIGSQAVTDQPVLALVDINSFWVHGYFRENYIAHIRKGDQAIVTLMSYPDTPLTGRVDSIGWGIAQQDGSTGYNLLPEINPTFEWIRLAQRIPVRIHLTNVPENVALRVGTTASVLVRTGTRDSKNEKAPVAVPRALE